MELSPFRLGNADAGTVECWDDDDDIQCGDEFYFRTSSTATSVTGSSARPSGHRDSVSSRRSWRSDRDSNIGDEESWQFMLSDQDELLTQDAVLSADKAGIPIPENIPKSALLGGTIKRLGGRKPQKVSGDDWSEDLDLPGLGGWPELRLPGDEAASPEALLHLNSLPTSPVKKGNVDPLSDIVHHLPASKLFVNDLDKFRDTEDDDDGSFLDVPTIKLAKSQSQQAAPRAQDDSFENDLELPADDQPLRLSSRRDQQAMPSTQDENFENDLELPADDQSLRLPSRRDQQAALSTQDENFENDLELPTDDQPLRLSSRRDAPMTPDSLGDEFDTDWAEGSIGVRFGGTKRDGFSNRSSTVSAMSPTVSSCLTPESEDEGLDGLVLPDGPLNLQKPLQKRKLPAPQQNTPELTPKSEAAKTSDLDHDDFFSGIDVGNGEVFDSEKLTLNRNVKRKLEGRSSPARRRATTITFTNKSAGTRIPRLSAHERPHSTHLEPVSESGAPVCKFTRPRSRLSGHSTHSSLSNIPLPSPPSTSSNLTLQNRWSTGSRTTKDGIRNEPTTTNAQLLKAKRSAPAVRAQPSAVPRSPSRPDVGARSTLSTRPKTPIDRPTTAALQRRPSVPFLPSGGSHHKSHHSNSKTNKHFRRTDSDSSGDIFSHQRSTSKSSYRSETPGHRNSIDFAADASTASGKHSVTRPTRRRRFGDGTELDIFDDLPTSATAETKFTKTPSKRVAPRALRNKLSQSNINVPPEMETSVQSTAPMSPSRPDSTPRFARDTNASRNARAQRISSISQGQRDRENGALAPVSGNWKAPRPLSSPTAVRSKPGHKRGHSTNRPHLIKPMGNGVHETKSVKGMQYNPNLYRWEGNENATSAFEAPTSTPPKQSPALISNFGGMAAAHVVAGMVFDPQKMCWLKVSSSPSSKGGVATGPDEDDVFAGLDDLDDSPQKSTPTAHALSAGNEGDAGDPITGDEKSGGESSDDWPITEEFDVGPEFIKRQRVEEEKWRRKVSKWVGEDRKKLGDEWRWAIRDLVRTDAALDVPVLSPTKN